MPKATNLTLLMTTERDREVKAYEIIPGLFAHRHHTRAREWAISHHSGLAVGDCCSDTLASMLRIGRMVQEVVPIDWTLDAKTIGSKHAKDGKLWREAFHHASGGGSLRGFASHWFPFSDARLSWNGEPVPTPSEAQVRAWMIGDHTCEALDGCTVEPDGHCEHGAPSFLLALGLI